MPPAFPICAAACSSPHTAGIGETTGLRCVAGPPGQVRAVRPPPQPQAAPFSVKLVGDASLPVHVPWNPMDVEPLAGIWAL